MNGPDALPETTVRQVYDPRDFSRLFAVEERHFWFRVRNQIIAAALKPITVEFSSGFRFLEVGCGTGNVLHALQTAYPHVHFCGIDLFLEALRYARERTNCPLVCADIHNHPFNTVFEVVALFDVLEHLPDDRSALRSLSHLIAPGGVLLLTVPAHASLWSYFDEASHHCRRYALNELQSKLTEEGFRVEYVTNFMTILYPLLWLGRHLTAMMGHYRANDSERAHELMANDLRIMPGVNGLLAAILSQEARFVARRRRLPIGTSLLAIARKA